VLARSFLGDDVTPGTLWDKSVLLLLLDDAELLLGVQQPLHENRHEPEVPGVVQPFHDFKVTTSDASRFAGGAWWRNARIQYGCTLWQLSRSFGGLSNMRECCTWCRSHYNCPGHGMSHAVIAYCSDRTLKRGRAVGTINNGGSTYPRINKLLLAYLKMC
jgi:hypothetical protein